MKTISNKIITSLFFSVLLLFMFAASAPAEGYKSLEGVKAVKAIFDFRIDNPASALVHIKLIHDTYKDKTLNSLGGKPDFVVVFMGPSVKILSSDRGMFSDADKKTLGEMDKLLTAMSKDGIRLEVCLFAAHVFGVDPEKIAPEIHRVANGWISSIGYQTNGYSLIPAF